MRFSPLLFKQNTLALSYFSLGMLLLVAVPLMLYMRSFIQRRSCFLLDIAALVAVLTEFILTLLQVLDIADFKETLMINHGVILISVLVMVNVLIHEWGGGVKNRKARIMLLCFGFCVIGVIIDMFIYYISGDSPNILIVLNAFCIFIVVMGVSSIRELFQRAQMDLHTGLFNKSCCNELLKNTAPLEATAVLVFDLNNLKRINDTYGHEIGDIAIRDFSNILRNATQFSDFVGRYGGDEFLMVLNEKNLEEVQCILDKIAGDVKVYNAMHKKVQISYAVGYALSDGQTPTTLHNLFMQADQAMYLDKGRCHREKE